MHPSITDDRVIEAVERDDCTGFCVACGEEQGGYEPDARRYRCEACGAFAVFGAEQLLFTLIG
jgi:hypothetical protein